MSELSWLDVESVNFHPTLTPTIELDERLQNDLRRANTQNREETFALLHRLLSAEFPGAYSCVDRFFSEPALFLRMIEYIVRDGQVPEDEDSIRRSYNTVTFFDAQECSFSQTISTMLVRHCEFVVSRLLDTFLPTSKGCIYHVMCYIKKLLSLTLRSTLAAVTDKLARSPVKACMIARLQERGTLELISELFKDTSGNENMRIPQAGIEEQRTELIREIRDASLISAMIARLITEDEWETVERISGILISFLSSLQPNVEGNNLCGYNKYTSKAYEDLLQAACAPSVPRERRKLYICALREILAFNLKVENELYAGESKATKNVFGPSSSKQLLGLFASYLPKLVEVFCSWSTARNAAAGVEFSSYTVPHAFTEVRLQCVYLIHDILTSLDQADLNTALVSVPGLWRTLVELFFQYINNSIYQNIFYKLFVIAISAENEAVLKDLLTKTKFISRLMKEYESTLAARGITMLILNFLRFYAESRTDATYLTVMLAHHHEWQNFLPTLIKDSEAIFGKRLGPVPQSFPGASMRSPLELAFMQSLKTTQTPKIYYGPPTCRSCTEASISDEKVTSLGSPFAAFLGFKDSVALKVHKPVTMDSAADTNADKPKKKNKKKKKKKKTKVVSTDAADGQQQQADEDDDDDGEEDENDKENDD